MISFSFFPATIISPLPLFRTINFANPSDKARQIAIPKKNRVANNDSRTIS